MAQYTLPLVLPPVFSEDNFFVSVCNREAHAWIMRWPDWPAHALLLHGPQGCGKSHLAAIWAAHSSPSPGRGEGRGEGESNAVLSSTPLPNPPPDRGRGNIIVEDIEQLEERPLLHLFNQTRENKQSLLLTATVPARELPFTLPDLTSRLLSIPSVAIGQPDDEVLTGAMRKQFADRQMKVDDEVIAYILPRMERSLARAKELVERLDKAALAEKKNITVPFVKRAMENL